MAEADTASSSSTGIPKWAWIVIIVATIAVLYLKSRSSSATAGTPSGVQAAPVDPNAAAIAISGQQASTSAFSTLATVVGGVLTNANTNAASVAATGINANEAIVTNGQTTHAQVAATGIIADTEKYLGDLSLKAVQSNNATTVTVAKTNASVTNQKNELGAIGGFITGVLAIFGL